MVARPVLDVVFPRVRESVPRARRVARDQMEKTCVGVLVDDLMVIVSELCTNAVQHAAGDSFRLRVAFNDAGFDVTVDDQGSGNGSTSASAEGPHRMPPADELRGRGLAIVEHLADEVRIREWPNGAWSVQARQRLIGAKGPFP